MRRLVAAAVVVLVALVAGCVEDRRSPASEAPRVSKTAPARAAPRVVCEAVIGRATVRDLIRQADVVFVGTVRAVGGNESFRGFDGYRVTFEVSRVLRGRASTRIEVIQIACNEIDLAEVGVTHLVFAEWRRLGEMEYRALTPSGYQQGVFRVRGDEAVNPDNGTVSLEAIAGRVARD